jgi:hypothetical protein
MVGALNVENCDGDIAGTLMIRRCKFDRPAAPSNF